MLTGAVGGMVLFGLSLAAPNVSVAWNRPGHMLSATVAYHVLKDESPTSIQKVVNILKEHPWYEARWQKDLKAQSEDERDVRLFMLAARWPDDIRSEDKRFNRPPWHYVNLPYTTQDRASKSSPAATTNILTALASSKNTLTENKARLDRAIALAWIFHLVGDIHQPLHAIQLFSRDYPAGDRGGNEMCVRATAQSKPVRLHALWDGLLTSSQNVSTIQKLALALKSRPEFFRNNLEELATDKFYAWASESYQIASEISYQAGRLIGTARPKGGDCPQLQDAAVIPNGYVQIARRIANRRIVVAGYRLADMLTRLAGYE